MIYFPLSINASHFIKTVYIFWVVGADTVIVKPKTKLTQLPVVD